ncbi:MAG: hypothetical protein C0594_15385 [Marinilabiliales bacterium]|nr:MAG: hypothetical protein C0594_15385 [Marinilabiliales bacterium]
MNKTDKLIFIKPKDLSRISNLSIRESRRKIRSLKDACEITNRDITITEYCEFYSIPDNVKTKMIELI